MSNREPITVWKRFNVDAQRGGHNHIENGHSQSNKPTGTPEQTASWAKSTWIKEHKYLEGVRIVDHE